jgi:ADP-ribose pyrophosphatase YjhB (NUDIX family)
MEVRKEAAAGVVRRLVDGEEMVLIVKKIEDGSLLSGQWSLVGETREIGDKSLEDTIVRGIEEETGVRARVVGGLGEHVTPKGTPVRWFLCETGMAELVPGDDATGARWVSRRCVREECDMRNVEMWPDEVKEYFS